MTYCCHIRAECPRRPQLETDTADNYGCVDWWEFKVEKVKVENGKRIPIPGKIEHKALCGRKAENLLEILQDMIATCSNALDENVNARSELNKGLEKLITEQRGGFVGLANGMRQYLEDLNGKASPLIVP